MKTRDRILRTARQLFNQKGYGNVTIASLAAELNMAKGNLWYHFNDKRSLLATLSEEFIQRDKQRRAIRPRDGAVLQEYANLLVHLLHELRDFRFLFRDQADYGEHTESMRKELPNILDESVEQFALFFMAMKKEGHLSIQSARIKDLALNVVIVLRYNLEFMRERQLVTDEDSGSVLATFEQHLTLFAQDITPNARRVLRASLRSQSSSTDAA